MATAGEIHVHKFYEVKTKEWIYFTIDQVTGVSGFCCMSELPGWVALETSMLYVQPESRGKGIASLIYDVVMKDGVIVISGYSHNPKSRKLWMNIVNNPKYTAWAHDIINLDRYADVIIDEGQIVCALKIYEDIKKMRRRRRQDVRIIAFNKRYLK